MIENYNKQLTTSSKNNISTIDPVLLSFKDYKINYNSCLGYGVFGNIYKVIKRPDNENKWLSSTFPYIYDYFYRIEKVNNEEMEKYCIKIYKLAIQVLYENNHSLPLRPCIESFFEPSRESKSNLVLRKYGISNITFFKTNSYYSQFKTRVRGKTFEYYLNNDYFISTDQYILRKNFILLLNLLLKANLCLSDVHGRNLMYDNYKEKWEIIDGEVKEISEGLDTNDETVSSWLHYLLHSGSNEFMHLLFNEFYMFAKTNEEYTYKKDSNILYEFCLRFRNLDGENVSSHGI